MNLEISELKSRLTELQEIIHSLEVEKDEFQAQMKDQAQIIEEFTISKTDLLSELETVKHKSECLTNISSDFQQQVADLSSKNETLREELSLAVAKSEDSEKQLCETKNQMNLEISELKSRLTELQENIHSLEVEKDEIQAQMKDQASSMKTRINDLEIQIEGKKAECLVLSKELADANGVLLSLQLEFSALDVKNKDLTSQLSSLTTGAAHLDNIIQEDNFKIDLQERTIKKLESNIKEQNNIIEKLKGEVSSLNQSLKKEQESQDPQLKEAYDKLFDDYHRLNSEQDELKVKLENQRSSIKTEYEEILAKMKLKMKSTCTRALEMKDEKHTMELKELKDVVKANQDHINQLSTNLWDTSDKLLITKNENEELKKTVVELKRMLALHQSVPDSLHRTRSHDQLGLQHQQHGLRGVEEEAATSSRRQSVRTVPSGIGKVFPSEDEAEEMFNNDCLADLKAGRCQVAAADPNRVSTLMYRNSLCPPHLKSSYPAETQFLPVDTLQEDDIKGRGVGEDTKLLTDKRRKDRTQPMELRNPATPRDALRELNDENRRPGTPSRLFSNIFAARPRRNENVTATPDRRRLSFFGRHFKKEPTE